MSRPLVWESVSWRCGEDSYRLDIERGGMFATLSAPGRRSITLPMVVWDGMLDALKANRATKGRSELQQFPARGRARWYDGEVAEVAEAYRAGRSIAEIAHAHNRSEFAIEHQLDRLGLISTAERHGPRSEMGREDRHSSQTDERCFAPMPQGWDVEERQGAVVVRLVGDPL